MAARPETGRAASASPVLPDAQDAAQQELTRRKLAKVAAHDPAFRPLRVLRILDVCDGVPLAPADGSLNNQRIRLAGGETPRFGAGDGTLRLTPDQWRAWNPEALLLCRENARSIQSFLAAPPWADVPALREGRVIILPCDEVCGAAADHGAFRLRLAAELYGRAFARPQNQVLPDRVRSRKPLDLPFSCVAKAEVAEADLFDFPAKALVIRFRAPQRILSSLGGWREGVTAVGNQYASPPSWPVTHHLGLARANARTMTLYGLDPKKSAFLYTGADMDHLASAEATESGLKAVVLATAGVRQNAMRAGTDSGDYVEPGTINCIILTSRRLTPAAMSRALITATEAKTAALQDLDIRSSYSGAAATGTGTDNIIVVAGAGAVADLTGGHSKLGELIAKATYQAVREAIARQNRLTPQRDLFQRLAERGVRLDTPAGHDVCPSGPQQRAVAAALERALREPRYAGFLAAALAISDNQERGLMPDTASFSAWCLAVAGELAGRPVTRLEQAVSDPAIPPLLREALNALAAGAKE